jgi:phosphatidylserine decarboxylase
MHTAHRQDSSPSPAPRKEQPAPIIAREGWPIVAMFIFAATVLIGLASVMLHREIAGIFAVVCIALIVWCIWFFRDPQRTIPTDPGSVICPADGRVVIIDEAPPPPELGLGETPMQRICIFMNVFNVHVNRSPVDGYVERIVYRPGTFLNASFDKASTHNERCSLVIRTQEQHRVVCVQIAGLIARRIVCRIREGVWLFGGERFGLIRFGSRVDVYLPIGATPRVRVGEITSAGSTVIATLPPLG